MDFVAPPYPDDVDEDFGPYSRDEIVVARASLLHSLQRENSTAWQSIKYKLGILPNGHRLRTFDHDHNWVPAALPELWSAPVVLHDPTATSGDGSPDQDSEETEQTEKRDGERKRGEEELSPRSDTQVTCGETRLSSDGGDVSDSRRPSGSGKRSRESPLHTENSVAKDKNLSRSERASTSSPSTSVDRGEAGEGSSKRLKLDSPEGGGEEQQYEVVFQCDLCPFLSQVEADVQRHLSQENHFSASKYLAVREAGTGALSPVYLSKASQIKEPQHLFKEKVPACPLCHSVFSSLQQCLSHTQGSHQREGLYCLRLITQSSTIDLTKDTGVCTDCGVEFKDGALRSHIRETQHIVPYNGCKTSDDMMVFICPFCHNARVNYFNFKRHLSKKHDQKMVECQTLTATCCTLGESCPAQTMLPKNPGIPKKNIKLNITKQQKGIKCKNQRWRKQQQLALQIDLHTRTEKVKRKKPVHKEKLAAIKAKRKERRRNKKEKKS